MTVCDTDVRLDAHFGSTRPKPVRQILPMQGHKGLVVACPHSGRYYPPELLAASRLDQFGLRRSEDAFVDILFGDAPTHGASLLVSEFARAFVDVNRSMDELDPKLIEGSFFRGTNPPSERVKAGLGVVPRTVGEGILIYKGTMTRQAADARIREVHVPWHEAIEAHMTRALELTGVALLLDCHSMPSRASGQPACDIVVGDRFGDSCAPVFANSAISFLRAQGLHVARNNPFAGGYSTSRHGQPLQRRHAMQIEINRSLYMVEGTLKLRPEFDEIGIMMSKFVSHLAELAFQVGQSH
jgi:N-formylglutamate amidohydrolase